MDSGVRTLLACLLLTLILEEAAALLFRVRGKKNLLLVAAVNVLTNPPAVLLTMFFSPASYPWKIFWVLGLEGAVVVLEGLIYSRCGDGFPHPYRSSFIFNLISYGAGTLLLKLGAAFLLKL